MKVKNEEQAQSAIKNEKLKVKNPNALLRQLANYET